MRHTKHKPYRRSRRYNLGYNSDLPMARHIHTFPDSRPRPQPLEHRFPKLGSESVGRKQRKKRTGTDCTHSYRIRPIPCRFQSRFDANTFRSLSGDISQSVNSEFCRRRPLGCRTELIGVNRAGIDGCVGWRIARPGRTNFDCDPANLIGWNGVLPGS